MFVHACWPYPCGSVSWMNFDRRQWSLASAIWCSEIASEAMHFWPKAALQLSVRLRMYDSNSYRRPHVMQWPLLKSPNFWFSSAEYYISLLSLGRGHNVARLDTRAPGSLRHAARLETSWPGQWLRYLAAVVSICENTVSNNGGLPCHCHDRGRLIGQQVNAC